MPKDYLGDSVYVDYDGDSLILTTENGEPNDPKNTIYLDPDVYAALVRYVDRVRAQQPGAQPSKR